MLKDSIEAMERYIDDGRMGHLDGVTEPVIESDCAVIASNLILARELRLMTISYRGPHHQLSYISKTSNGKEKPFHPHGGGW